MKGILKNVQIIVIFMLIWVVLNENVKLLTLLIGFFVSVSTLRFTNSLLKVNYAETFYVPPIAFLLYAVMLIKEIYVSGYDMIKRIFTGNITPTFIEYDSSLSDQLALVLLSNSITLPPGGVTVSRHERHLTILSANSDEEAVLKDVAKYEEKLKGFERELRRIEKKLSGFAISNKA